MSFPTTVAGLEQRHMICLVEVRAGEVAETPISVNNFHAEVLLEAGHLVAIDEGTSYATTPAGKAWVEEHARGMMLGEIEALVERAQGERDRIRKAARVPACPPMCPASAESFSAKRGPD